MNIPTELLALLTLIIVGAFIAQPFFSRQEEIGVSTGRHRAATFRRRAELIASRNDIYGAIRDLDFDYKTNKVSDEDYRTERHRLVAAGVDVLQQLDHLPDDSVPELDSVEALIGSLAGERPAMAARPAPAPASGDPSGGTAKFCPHCGEPLMAGDRFCGACGGKL